MIFTDRKITIRNGKSSINEPVILYRGDYEVSIRFTIMESKFRFKSGVNLVDSEKASHGQLAILAPYGGNVFSEVVKCEDGTVTFTLTKEMIDQLEEVGLYSFQIRLFDYYRESRVSIPPVEFGIEVREPVASEDHDNEVNNAIVGYSIAKVVDGLNEDVPDTFDSNGQYNKTEWETGDRITEGKLNKIEDAIDKINQNEKADVAALDKRVTNNFNVLSVKIDDKVGKNDTISVNKIDKNLGKIDQTYLSDELIQQIAGTANVNPIVENNSITINKLTFMPALCKNSLNLFNKYRYTNNKYVNYTDGNLYDSDAFITSDYIEVIPGQSLVKNTDNMGAFYNASKQYISGIPNGENIFIVPDNALYFRYCMISNMIETAMLVVGDTLPSSYIEPIELDENMIGTDSLNMINTHINENYFDVNLICAWNRISISGNTVNLGKRQTYQNIKTGRWILITSSEDMIFTIEDGYALTFTGEFKNNTADSSVYSLVPISNKLNTNSYPLITNVAGLLSSPIPFYQQFIYHYAYVKGRLDNDQLNMINTHINENYFDVNLICAWNRISISGNTVNLGKRQTYQNIKTGRWILITSSEDMIFTIEDGYALTFTGEFKNNTADSSVYSLVPISNKLNTNSYPLITNVAGLLSSPIPFYQQFIYHYTFNNRNTNDDHTDIMPISINERLSQLAPVFYEKYKEQKEDVCVVLMGDSISTTNHYAKVRLDAMNRPPLMTEYGYPTYIEEQLRWDGQKYYRYDTGIFTETCTNSEILEYDTVNWDWASNNNRPALTKVLTGSECSVKFKFPSDALRCDFIYRTDKLNADSCKVIVSAGSGLLEVYNETTSTWVEAHNFVYSAKENESTINTTLGVLNKSMYQKRLKMRVKNNIPNTHITISNMSEGRLTYWGIQTSIRKVMFDFILAARGGHSITRLEQFEEWDIDYYEPDLILWECPILNHNMDVCTSDFQPKNMGNHTTDAFAQPFMVKANELINKPYKPELVSWIMWFGIGNNAINDDNEWCYGVCSDGERVSVPNYVSKLHYTLIKNNINNLNLFDFYMDYARRNSEINNKNIRLGLLVGSGTDGDTLTIDGGHFNTKGAKVTRDIFGSFFIH